MPSPGEDIQAWSPVAATNANSDPLINWAEGQPRASVNNSARSMLAAHAKDRNLKNGSITTGGTANAQTFTSGVAYTTPVPTGLTVRLKVGISNTGATTLNMDGIGDVVIKDQAGADIGANALLLGRYVDLLYNGTNWILLSVGAAAAPFDALAYSGMQINGAMEVSQEGGANITGVAGTSSPYIVDGWWVNKTGTMLVNGQQVTDAPPGYTNSMKITIATAQVTLGAGDYIQIVSPIEGFRTSRLQFGTANAQSVSIGFWTKIHRIGNYSASIRNAIFNRSYPFTFTQNVADTWEYKTVTIPGDLTGTWVGNSNGVGLYFTVCMASGNTFTTAANAWTAGSFLGVTGTTNGAAATTDTLQITGVVILPGVDLPALTRAPFIMRPFTDEIEVCQRYYAKSYDYSVLPGTATSVGAVAIAGMIDSPVQVGAIGTGWRFPRRMRAAPSVTVWATNGVSGAMMIRPSGIGPFAVPAGVTQIGETGVQAIYSTGSVSGLVAGQAIELVFGYVANARL